MQFHLNGFRTGDPQIQASGRITDACPPAEVDVLIVGAGPAGLTLAAQLARIPGLRSCLVERKAERLTLGQADGIACRTMEMFDAFGFSERVLREAYWVNETTFWKPDASRPGDIARSGRIQDTPNDLSHFPHVILNQARIHDFFLDVMAQSISPIVPLYARELRSIRVTPTADRLDLRLATDGEDAFPVTVQLERLDPEHAGEIETIRARFVVGCDGARSSVRRELGLSLDGRSANQAWGVMDVLATTDFPDFRLKTAIHSQSQGSILMIPREGGYLNRLYIELDELGEDERVADRGITADQLIASAERILHPYRLDVKEVAWWSVYEIGQRLSARFDDVPEDEREARVPRVFIAGDACHTHSPKAGQGMNVSMQDSFNLGWKLASVLSGASLPRILHSYSRERHAIARELIDFDSEMARMFSARPKNLDDPESEGIDPAEFQAFFEAQSRFTAGTATHYPPSLVSGEVRHQSLATGLVQGMRFHSAPVIRLADARPMQLGDVLVADGRWRLVIFAPAEDPTEPRSQVRQLCEYLGGSDCSPLLQYTAAGNDIDSVIDVRAVIQDDYRDVAFERMPDLLKPAKGRYGLKDYEKVFCADRRGGRDIFALRGIDRSSGCVVVIRPDQYIAHILPLSAQDELEAFFGGFMIEVRRPNMEETEVSTVETLSS